ncbi:MAG TPA: FAD-dependent oxidoreductase [Segeticoccus sp.]|uniref:oxidoreductase n=1 Tax=Segeticoccus sp. TaxID=2706531 RepID=UPI002D805044|nr:FAD-dependent oxidoreductase [Segeticoccus sp.]HET8600226.1 FAD-dependent oxidoreductase [Segeticoccus sp.]
MPDLLWRPGRIGRLPLPHRVVMGSMHLGLEDRDDGGRALATFYAERARGGAGLIITGGWAVNRVGAGGPHYGLMDEPRHRPTLARVVREVHAAGGRMALQLFHAGRYAVADAFGLQPVAPSAVPSRFSPAPPHALTAAEVAATADDFARAAQVAAETGFDAVELMGSEGYLLNQFVSPVTNRREDDYGGDPARRRCFPLEVVVKVRAAVGVDFPVIYRMSGADLVPGSTSGEQTVELARALAAAGVDAINVGIGWHESPVPTVQLTVPPVAWAPEAAAVKSAVGDLPVIAGNRVNRLGQGEELLRSGAADFVAMARPFLADPEIVAKGRPGAGPGVGRAVNVCIACDQACIDRSLVDEPVSCMVNPRAGRERELPAPAARSGGGRRYVVAGAGPAGLAAARELALAGAQVELFEREAELGGQFRLARLVPGKDDYGETVRYYAAELDRLGVEVRLGRPLGPGDLADLSGADGVVVATGVRPRVPWLPGADLPHVLTYPQAFGALAGGRASDIGTRVAVVGAGGIGVDLAHVLLRHPTSADGPGDLRRFRAEYLPLAHGAAPALDPPARQVTLMRRTGRVGAGIGRSTRWVLVGELRRRGAVLRTGVRYEAIVAEGVRVIGPDGPELVAADTVVLAAGQLPHDPLSGTLAQQGVPHLVVGGARSTDRLNAVRAFEEGLLAARALIGNDVALRDVHPIA